MADNIERITTLFGFDPGRKESIGQNVLEEALLEIKKERAVKSKEVAKELLSKAIDLREQMEKKRREFDGQSKKFDKELGKLMNRLEAMAQGKNFEEEHDEKDNQA